MRWKRVRVNCFCLLWLCAKNVCLLCPILCLLLIFGYWIIISLWVCIMSSTILWSLVSSNLGGLLVSHSVIYINQVFNMIKMLRNNIQLVGFVILSFADIPRDQGSIYPPEVIFPTFFIFWVIILFKDCQHDSFPYSPVMLHLKVKLWSWLICWRG